MTENPLPAVLLPLEGEGGDESSPQLLIGSFDEALDVHALANAHGVTHVYSCLGASRDLTTIQQRCADAGIVWKGCLAQDSAFEPLLEARFAEFKAFVDSAAAAGRKSGDDDADGSGGGGGGGGSGGEGSGGSRGGGAVLVHCSAGINRSGLLGLAYVLAHTRRPLLSVLEAALRSRGPLLWNRGFQRQLVEFAHREGLPLT